MEIKIAKPTKYVDSLLFEKETGFSYYQKENEFFLSGNATEQELLASFELHNPTQPLEPTVQEKLAAAGITIDELKEALGL